MNSYSRYLKAEKLLNEGLIRRDLSLFRPHSFIKTPGERLKTMEIFLKKSGTRGINIPAIHITGTSGKGTTAAITARILQRLGLKVGLHTSPYLQSATEKIIIDGKYISADQFADLVEWIEPVAKEFLSPMTPASIHGMASVAIALEGFYSENVDVIVFEAGCGGRFDLTRFIDTKVAVITNVGMDHVLSLGPSLEDIAWHKAGIIKNGSSVFHSVDKDVSHVIDEEAKKEGASVKYIPKDGDALKQNFNLALEAALDFAKQNNITFNRAEIIADYESLTEKLLPGRMEKMRETEFSVFLDGAHNHDKLKVATDYALSNHKSGIKVALVGFLGAKASSSTVEPLINKFDYIIATEPVVFGKSTFPAADTGKLFSNVKIDIEPDSSKALKIALQSAKNGTLLITGSFYLCGELRNYWYPKKKVILDRTSW
ncbi:MAG: hypothetical protein JXR91_15750 [Deltaproteobacteria bacterium]|nr:hypothetical protein [Deltaproteobacteria bacterium]